MKKLRKPPQGNRGNPGRQREGIRPAGAGHPEILADGETLPAGSPRPRQNRSDPKDAAPEEKDAGGQSWIFSPSFPLSERLRPQTSRDRAGHPPENV